MATRKKKAAGPTPVEATEHTEASRLNIPTAELESFAREAEREPKKLLYPRDPSLDPQLVWKGKDEQDSQPLEVPAVPIYIQETIEPRSLIEDLRVHAKAGQSEEQVSFFDSYEGLEFGEKVDFYQHAGKWANRMILGDSLLVMASLAEKEGLKGQVQMIYMDPPYGIKFGSNWQVSTRKREVSDGKVQDASRQPEQIRAFRDTWELGIHSYLSYLRDRLQTAYDLLSESGSLFLQIGDQNLHLVRAVLDEVFGSQNFCSLVSVKKTSGATTDLLPGTTDYVVWYARNRDLAKYRTIYRTKAAGGAGAGAYDQVEFATGERRRASQEERLDPDSLPPDARPFRYQILTSQSMGREKGEGAASWFPVSFEGQEFRPSMQGRWKTNEEGMRRLLAANRVARTGNGLSYVRYLDDFPAFPLTNFWDDTQSGSGMDKVYAVQTNTKVVERCVLMTTDPGDLVLDPTCGSGTTAYVAEHWGRRWLTVDTSRVALALARTRLMTARLPFFLLADSSQGAFKEAELRGRAITPTRDAPFSDDVAKGFVYQRVPHLTLKSIAQNPDIREGMPPEEISAAVARHTDTEVLYDRPYQDSKVVRVAGPFTVESLSPHRVLVGDPELGPAVGSDSRDSGRFVDHVLGNLRKSGVQNTVRGERLEFVMLEPWPGTYVQAQGNYKENGRDRTAAVCIGPEHGTVGTELVREAAKEAAKAGADMLVICGFAFEPLVADEAKQFGRLTILNTKMNPDLQMPDLLKKTGAGNLFMVFGEPDIDVCPADDGRIHVEIRGVDVYDPTTGQVRSHSTDDIACWFIDTDYNGESFFVRHAYFSGGGDPYDKLKRALKADIDEEAWASLYSTTSRPFPKPDTGKIAVKVINHFGDEVMKVYDA